MTIGEKIKTFRKIAGLTQQELAENVGVSRSHLASIETGKYQPSIETLNIIASGLGVKSSDIINDDDTVSKKANTIKNNLNELRQLKELTLGDVAKIINDTIPNVVIYENNIRQPSPEQLEKLAKHCNVSIDYLSGKTKEPYSSPLDTDVETAVILIEEGGKTKTFYELTSEELSLVKAMITTIKSEKAKNQ